MPREKDEPRVVNFDDLGAKLRFLQAAKKLKGLQEVSIRPRKKTRSLNANAYYWSAYIPDWADWLREQYGDPTITTEQAHQLLKVRVLGPKEKILDTGEVLEIIPETHSMDQEEFGLYLDKAKEFLREFAQIIVLDSDLFWESKERRVS